MGFWIVLAIITYVICFIGTFFCNKNKRLNYVVLMISIIFWWIILAFRYMIGWDYYSYSKLYYSVEIDDMYIDKSFIILSIIFRNLGFDYQIIFIVYASAMFFFIYKGLMYYKDKQIVAWGLFILLPMGYFNAMGYIRQALAVSIFFWSIRFIVQKKLIKYILSILLASCIHFSALILLPVYYLIKIKYKAYMHFLLCGVMFILAYFNITADLISYVLGVLDLRYLNYMQRIARSPSIGNIMFFLGVWLMVFVNSIITKSFNKTQYEIIKINLCTMCIVFMCVFYFDYVFLRLKDYFSIIFIAALSDIIITYKKYQKIIVFNLIYLVAMSYFFITWIHVAENPSDALGLIPSSTNIKYEFNFNVFR